MNGGLTWREMELRKAKASALDDALDYLEGRCDSEKLMQVERILRRGLTPVPKRDHARSRITAPVLGSDNSSLSSVRGAK